MSPEQPTFDEILARASGQSASGSAWRLRIARPDDPRDNERLCALFKAVSLGGDLDLLQERDPDFFTLLGLHGGEHATCLLEDEAGTLGGCGSLVSYPGWFDQEPIQTGYLCDLRSAPEFRGVGALASAYAAFMEWAEARFGAEVFTTVIFDKNIRALNALRAGGSGSRASQPLYRPITPFEMISVQFTAARPPRASRDLGSSVRVARATDRDRDELLDWLCRGQRARRFGWRADPDQLQRRWEGWPGFSYDDFVVARDPNTERVIGCLAPWDTAEFKRTRVLGYGGAMRWQRHAYNMMAALRGWTPLPQPGDRFHFSFLTHLEVSEERPDVLAALLSEAYAQLAPQARHFMSAFVPRGSPLRAAFKPYITQSTAMTLYAVCRAESRFASLDLTTRNPGFEMALS